MEYERSRSVISQYVSVEKHTDINYATHLHANMELVYVTSGQLLCTISGCEYTVSEGEAALIMPNKLHGYKTPEKSSDIILIFSSDYIKEFYNSTKNADLENPVFRPDRMLLDIDPIQHNRFIIKGKLYQLCGEVLSNTSLKRNGEKNDMLMQKIIEYITDRYTEQITLREMAKILGYNYYYLSGFINENFGSSFSDIVNNYRINDAQILLRSTDISIAQVSSRCGFGSIRSFNRAFRQILGITPKDYLAGSVPSE